jgi:hypothetical protein
MVIWGQETFAGGGGGETKLVGGKGFGLSL